MAAIRLMRKWSVPLATAVAAPIFTPVVLADSDKKDSQALTSRMVKPSELPIYETPQDTLDFEYYGKERTSLEDNIGVVRKEVEGIIEVTRSTREKIVHICETGQAHTMAALDMLKELQPAPATIDYITDEENTLPRAGAITVGGLTGLVIGRKGGFLKKILYTSTGALTAASLCYPRHAYQASQKIFENAKDAGTIGYNFVAGVKPQNKAPNAPAEAPKEESPAVAPEASSPAPEAVAVAVTEAVPETTPAKELEGGEVRKVIPENVSVEDFLSPLDTITQQASDVALLGFRLTDSPSEDAKDKKEEAPTSKPAVPEGFGTVIEVQQDTEQVPEEPQVKEEKQELESMSDTTKTKELLDKVELSPILTESELAPASLEPEPEVISVTKSETEVVPVITEPRPDLKEPETDTTPSAIEPDQIVSEVKPLEEEIKGTEILSEKETQVATDIISVQESTPIAAELEKAEIKVEDVQKKGLVNKIIQFFSNDKEDKVESVKEMEPLVKEVVIEGGEKAEKVIAEAVHDVAEGVEKESAEIIKESEVVEEISKKVESALDVVEDVAGTAAEAAHETPGIPESVAEKAEETKLIAEKVEEVVGTVEFVAEKVEEIAKEIKKEAEIIEDKALELIESKEKREELIEKAIDFVTEKVKEEIVSTEVQEPIVVVPEVEVQQSEELKTEGEQQEQMPLVEESKKEAMELAVDIPEVKEEDAIPELKGKEKISEVKEEVPEVPGVDQSKELAVHIPEVKEKVEIPEVKESETPEVKEKEEIPEVKEIKTEIEHIKEAETEKNVDEKVGLVDKIIQFFSNDKEEPIQESVQPVVEEMVVEAGEKVEEKVAEAVSEVAKDIEKEADEVIKVAEVVEVVSEKADSALDVVEDITSSAATAAQDTPELPEFVEEKSKEAEEVTEKVQELVSTVEFVAEKVEEIAEDIKKEAEAIESKALELVESKEKREELVEQVIEFVTGTSPKESESLEDKASEESKIEEPEEMVADAGREPEVPTTKPEAALADTPSTEPIEKAGLVDKIKQFFSNEKEEVVQEVIEPVLEKAVIEGGERVEKETAEIVSEVAQEIEKDADDISKVAEVIEGVSEKVESVADVVEDVAGATANVAHDTHGVPEYVTEIAEETKAVAEKVEEVVSTIELVAEKVEEFVGEVKKEAEIIENKAVELLESKEKREELIEKAIEFVVGESEELASTEAADPSLVEITEEKQIEDAASIPEEKEIASTGKVEKGIELETTGGKGEEADTSVTVGETVQKEETGLVDKIIQFFSSEDKQEPIKEIVEPLVKEAVLEGGERVEEKIAEAVRDITEGVEKEATEVIKESEVIEEVSKMVESALDVVEDVGSAAAEAAHDIPGIPVSVAEKVEETKFITEKVEEVVGTVEFVAEKIEEIAEDIKQEAEVIQSKAEELIESKEKREELIEKAIDFVTGNIEEDVQEPAPIEDKGSKGENLMDKIISLFSDKPEVEQSKGVTTDSSKETDISDSPTEAVPEPVAGVGSSPQAATSVTGPSVSEESQVQSPSSNIEQDTVEVIESSVSGSSTPEIIDVPSAESPAFTEKEQEPILEVKDKSLFDRLSEFVTSDEKQNIVSKTDAATYQSAEKSIPQSILEKDQQETSDSDKPIQEAKPSLLDKIATIFTSKDAPDVTETEKVPSKGNKIVEDKKYDVFIVTANPNHPVEVASEESARQSKTSLNNVQRVWFRTGADVKQEGKDVIVQLTPNPPPVEKDFGQSNPEDNDMYTTRS